jgi:hypothetical protein
MYCHIRINNQTLSTRRDFAFQECCIVDRIRMKGIDEQSLSAYQRTNPADRSEGHQKAEREKRSTGAEELSGKLTIP